MKKGSESIEDLLIVLGEGEAGGGELGKGRLQVVVRDLACVELGAERAYGGFVLFTADVPGERGEILHAGCAQVDHPESGDRLEPQVDEVRAVRAAGAAAGERIGDGDAGEGEGHAHIPNSEKS